MRARLIVLLAFSTVLLVHEPAQAAARVSGVVRDAQDAAVPGADLVLTSADRTVVLTARSDSAGRFTFDAVQPGRYVLTVRASFLSVARQNVVVSRQDSTEVTVRMSVAGTSEEITVTAAPHTAHDAALVGQAVAIVDRADIESRVKTVVAQALEGETGVALQRTSPTMAGIFVRGLTGNKVNVFVDGVRYSNGAQRGGVNTFLDLIETASLESVEVLRGPSSAQYGSDALGGSVQFLTRPPSLAGASPRLWTTVGVGAGTAHRNGGLDASLGYMRRGIGVTATVAGRKVGLLRPGGGVDSHSAITRFLGLPSTTFLDERLPDTGFDQAGGSIRLNWLLTPTTHVVSSYFRSDQDRGRRFDQLIGGDGNLIAELNGLTLDLFYTRVERFDVGPFESLTLTYSLNSQREERVNQGGNGNPAATIGHEPERTTVHGVQGAVTRQFSRRLSLTLGGDIYFEKLASDAFNVNPATGVTSIRRPRVPDQATFRQGGVYAQTVYEAKPDLLRLVGAARIGGAHYNASASDAPVVNGAPLWPSDDLGVGSVTFRGAAVVTPRAAWTLTGSVGRGFRAPHMTDLGTLGLTGSGFEVAAPDVAGLNAFVGTTADATAVSSGAPVRQLTPESSVTYEGSIRYREHGIDSDVTVFVNHVYDNVQKVALILPPGAVGASLGGTPITSQNANGAVFVAATTVPVLVRANFDNARIWGVEHSARVRIGPRLLAQSAFTYLHARDTHTDLPPNIEGGTPAPELWFSVQYTDAGGRWWVQPYFHAAREQTRLSTLDLGDRRIGSSRSRANIQAFLRNGATARGWVTAGPDGALGTADDILTATGETLTQVQNRVLGVGVNSGSLFPSIPGYRTIGIRSGLRLGRHDLVVDLENLNDENYRGLSWGMDAPGRGVSVRFIARLGSG